MSPRTRKDIPNPKRCTWAEGDPLMEKYHDEEWGFPVRTTRKHFEQLTLEIFQAGLSWRTILHKRAEFRKEFLRFSPEKVALFTEKDIRRILGNPGVVRNRKKIEATIENAKRFLAIQKKHGSFNRYLASLPDDLPSLQRYSARNSPSWVLRSQKPISKAWGRYPNSTIRAAGGMQ